jgi:hypothetical protein
VYLRPNRHIYIDVKNRGLPMSANGLSGPEDCNGLAARQAVRPITQFYDRFLAPSGLRTTQFSILQGVGGSSPSSPTTRRTTGVDSGLPRPARGALDTPRREA